MSLASISAAERVFDRLTPVLFVVASLVMVGALLSAFA